MAATHQSAAESLFQQGLYVATLRQTHATKTSRLNASLDDHATALRTLAELLDAGLPPLRALQLLRETAPASWVEELASVCVSVEQGSSVATALRDSGLGLPSVVGGLLQSGEAGMGLANATRQAANLLDRRSALRQSLVSALAYPMILLATGSASVALLVMVVLPKFAVILHGLGTQLPLSTRFILGLGESIRALGPAAAIIFGGSLVAARVWYSTDAGARGWGDMTLRVPGVGRIAHALVASQAIHVLGSLLMSGVTISVALEHAAAAAGNRAVEARLLKCRDAVRSGESLSASFLATNAVPVPIMRLARAGEETGRLAEMLIHGATLEHHRAEQRIKAAVRLIEPMLILAFGAAIAVVASALFQAMYSIRPGT